MKYIIKIFRFLFPKDEYDCENNCRWYCKHCPYDVKEGNHERLHTI